MWLADQLSELSPVLLGGLRVFLYFLPVVLAYGWFTLWMHYIRLKFIKNTEWVTLEVRLPREIFKGPDAMELLFSAFYQPANPNLVEKYLLGNVRPWSSLELISNGGRIHFILRINKKLRNVIEAHVYSQYPGVELVEMPDYTRDVPYGSEGADWQLFGTEFTLTKDDAYPIKTYMDYGFFADKKEEFKADPLTPTLEYLASIPPGHQVWIQILVMATQARFKKAGAWFATEDWVKNSQALLDKLKKKDEKDTANFAKTALTGEELETVKAIERNMGKFAFDTGIRAIYLAPSDKFNPGYIGGLMGVVKQFNTVHRNGFKPQNVTKVNYPLFQDIFGTRVPQMKRDMFDAYIRRSYFYAPYMRKPFVLSTEELATIYHFPGRVAETPTLGRIESKRGEPPANLPV